jgi:cytochrome c
MGLRGQKKRTAATRRSLILIKSVLEKKPSNVRARSESLGESAHVYEPVQVVTMMMRAGLMLLLLATPGAFAEEAAIDPLTKHGETLARNMCAECHSIGKTGPSPHAGAPPFRELARRLELDFFADRLRDELTVGHPDMPSFRFTREDAGAFVLYLRSIQVP